MSNILKVETRKTIPNFNNDQHLTNPASHAVNTMRHSQHHTPSTSPPDLAAWGQTPVQQSLTLEEAQSKQVGGARTSHLVGSQGSSHTRKAKEEQQQTCKANNPLRSHETQHAVIGGRSTSMGLFPPTQKPSPVMGKHQANPS